MEKIRIIYIFGSGHSGSTLAALMLGVHSQIECVGEMKQYERSMKRKRPCNCGRVVEECPYWREVFHLAGGDPGGVSAVLNPSSSKAFAESNARFIRAILQSSGKSVFCDSSKTKKRLHKYLKCPEFEVHVLHLVRDGRAVLFSNLKKQRAFWGYCSRWKKRNIREKRALFDAGLPPERYHCIRYEELARRPEAILRPFLQALNLEFESGQLKRWADGNHHIGGNHMARDKGGRIFLDTRYLDALGPLQWVAATVLQAPVLKAYRYPLSRRKMRKMLFDV